MSQPATPGKQRFLKLGILLITPFSILAAFGAFTANAWLSFSSEQYRSAVNSRVAISEPFWWKNTRPDAK